MDQKESTSHEDGVITTMIPYSHVVQGLPLTSTGENVDNIGYPGKVGPFDRNVLISQLKNKGDARISSSFTLWRQLLQEQCSFYFIPQRENQLECKAVVPVNAFQRLSENFLNSAAPSKISSVSTIEIGNESDCGSFLRWRNLSCHNDDLQDVATAENIPVDLVNEFPKINEAVTILDVIDDENGEDQPDNEFQDEENDLIEDKGEMLHQNSLENVIPDMPEKPMSRPSSPLLCATQMYSCALDESVYEDENEDQQMIFQPEANCRRKSSVLAGSTSLTQAYVAGLEDAENDLIEAEPYSTQNATSSKPSLSLNASQSRPQIMVWPWQKQNNTPRQTESSQELKMLPKSPLKANGPQQICSTNVEASKVSSPVLIEHERFFNVDSPAVLREFVPPAKIKRAPSSDVKKPPAKLNQIQEEYDDGSCYDSEQTPAKKTCHSAVGSSTEQQASPVCPWINLPKLAPTVPWRRQRRLGLYRPSSLNSNISEDA